MRSSLTAARKEVAPEGLQRQGRSHLTKRLPGSTATLRSWASTKRDEVSELFTPPSWTDGRLTG